MHIGILSVRDDAYHPNNRLMAAALEMGHRVSLIHTRDCLSCVKEGQQRVILPDAELPDVLLPRVGATINDYALSVVRHFELSGTRVVNGFQSILMARNKFMGLQRLAKEGVSVPHTYLAVTHAGFERSVEQFGGYPVVAKMPSSRQGNGVMLVENQATASFVMNNLMDNTKGILVQEYLPPRRAHRYSRVCAGRPGGWRHVAKTQGKGFQDQYSHHRTGTEKLTLNPRLSDLAVRSSCALGLEISGCDIILQKNGSPKVLEVNYSPGFRGLEHATGMDIAKQIIHYVTVKK
jgi:ribosomal protein S6--L-glutamate ligase